MSVSQLTSLTPEEVKDNRSILRFSPQKGVLSCRSKTSMISSNINKHTLTTEGVAVEALVEDKQIINHRSG